MKYKYEYTQVIRNITKWRVRGEDSRVHVREDEAQEGDEEEAGEAERDLQEPVAHLLPARAEEAGARGGLAREQVEERDV